MKAKKLKTEPVDDFEKTYRRWVHSGYLTRWLIGDDVRRRELVKLLEEAAQIWLKNPDSDNVDIIAGICFSTIRRLYVEGYKFNVPDVYAEVENDVLMRLSENKDAFGYHDIDSEMYVQQDVVEKYWSLQPKNETV